MKKEIFKKGIEKTGIPYILFENILIAAMLITGFLVMQPVRIKGVPIISLVYLLFSLSMLIFILRKQLCTQCCYFGKACHCGWGLLASAFYKKKSGNQKLGGILAGITWGTIMLLPILIMIVNSTLIPLGFKKTIFFFIPFFLLTVVNGFLHKVDCEKCKMKFICPGSAARN